ncbi:MAG: hypothetical protein M0R80_00680 [Proteobacteria bacterium]|jgi:hypothetical protein|nr:hypothetical protein [Pseudomonadota bacterium]
MKLFAVINVEKGEIFHIESDKNIAEAIAAGERTFGWTMTVMGLDLSQQSVWAILDTLPPSYSKNVIYQVYEEKVEYEGACKVTKNIQHLCGTKKIARKYGKHGYASVTAVEVEQPSRNGIIHHIKRWFPFNFLITIFN